MTPEQRETLQDLIDCHGQVDQVNFSKKEIKVLKELEKQRLVALRWVVTDLGKQKVKE